MTEKELIKKIKDLDDEIDILADQKLTYQQLLCEILFDIKIGDIIEYEGNKYKISGFHMFWPIGYMVKKDGNFSSKAKNLYNIIRKEK